MIGKEADAQDTHRVVPRREKGLKTLQGRAEGERGAGRLEKAAGERSPVQARRAARRRGPGSGGLRCWRPCQRLEACPAGQRVP